MRRCRCHDEPMERNSGSRGGWRCAVKRRDRQRAEWHTKRKHDPIYQIDRQLRSMAQVRVR